MRKVEETGMFWERAWESWEDLGLTRIAMWCTRWFLPLLLLPLPTAPPFFLLLFLFSLTLHAKPCFYCIVLLATLFVTSCYWQPFPLDSPLATPWSENITTFSEALNASLQTNYSQPLPTVIRAVDRCWCDLSAGSFFEPFNVSRWEHLSVARLKNELERLDRAALEPNTTLPSITTESAVNATQIPVESSVVNANSQHTWSQFTNWLFHRRRVAERRNDVMEKSETGPVKEAESWLRKEYDLRPQGFDVVLDFSW